MNGRVVEFELWDAFTIENLLVDQHSHGLREYWFNEIELAATWFRSTFQKIQASLEERYNPDDHVEVSTELLFGGLLRDERLKSEINLRITDIAAAMPKHRDGLHDDVEATFNRLSSAVQDLVGFRPTALENPTEPFPVGRYRELSADIDEALAELSKAIDQHKPSKKPDERRNAVDQSYEIIASGVWQVRDACDEFKAFLDSDCCRADRKRFALLIGRAGAGKSHLLASQIDQMTVHGIPAVMLLGSHFADARMLFEQIPAILGLSCDLETFLSVLNAAGEARHVRALIAIDAINEGGGKRWQHELGGLLHSLRSYPWISLAASCRTEYQPYLISAATSQEAATIEIPGFVTAEEQERAAEVYLDKRGILRPATPWLSPEFNNPLFLRTTAIALEREGKHEYPKGLHGTKKVLAFFLKVMGRNLATSYDGSDELTPPLAAAVKSLAAEMAHRRQDYLDLPVAQALVDQAFAGFSRTDLTWLDHLRLRGILRLDPFLSDDSSDPLDMPGQVVRFAFQRFQDHLVAESLLNSATPSRAGFQGDGPFAFLLRRYGRNGHSTITHEWVGVFEALWIGHAERNKRELVDDLPDDARVSFNGDLFIETVYWRSPDAFTDRTLEIFNRAIVQHRGSFYHDHIRVLLRLCVSDHPWNSDLLHRNLEKRKLPDRDVFWTHPINEITRHSDDGNEVERLIRWCQSNAVERASDIILGRALTTLGWLFTTTNRGLRDKATKAATWILLKRPKLLSEFFSLFAGVDDPYVLERVAAACAGACLRDPSQQRLKDASLAAYRSLFESGSPPLHILTRDYGRSIVELANDNGVLPSEVEIYRCRPPYKSKPPQLPRKTGLVEKRAKKVGADSILSSCTGWVGDFGRYVVKSRVDNFTKVRLSSGAPAVPKEQAWEHMQSLAYDANAAKFWVANRAIALGWTKERFPKDFYGDSNRGKGSRIERIGKKYQWIAYFELLARLADNYWMLDKYAEPCARRYDTPLDTSYVRDIEITFPPTDGDIVELNSDLGPRRRAIDEVEEEKQADWVFEKGVAEKCLRLGHAEDIANQDEWVSLYRYSSAKLDWPEQEPYTRHNFRQDEFHFQMLVGIHKDQVTQFVDRARARKTDFHEWLPGSQTDAGYLYELGQRSTWVEGRYGPERDWRFEGEPFTYLTIGYHWESHLDGTLPFGVEMQLTHKES